LSLSYCIKAANDQLPMSAFSVGKLNDDYIRARNSQ